MTHSTATLLIHNAAVHTVDDANPTAQAVAVRGGEIIFVGSNEEAWKLVGEGCRVVDADGRSLLPGFIDSHFHLAWGSQTLMAADLRGVETLAELEERIGTWREHNPDQPWVLGQAISYALPTPDVPLTRHILDKIEAERPLILTAYDMHSMFVNSRALEVMGLTHGTSQPMDNGIIPVDTDGYATGELYEMDAMNFVYAALPEPTVEQTVEITKAGLALCAQHGITSIHNMDGEPEQAALYAALEEQGELTLRVYIPFWVKPGMTVAQMEETAVQMRDAYQSDKVRSNCVKFFMDGVYESYTAVTLNGYPDQLDNHGDPIWDAQTFAQFTTVADRLGLQIFTHACGDGAVRRVLDGYEMAQRVNGERDGRHRVEHIEMIAPEDIPRFAELGVIASMQPLHAPLEENDPDIWPQRVDPAEWDWAFAWRTLREAGATLVFGSDWPVVTLSPMLGIWGAVNRQPLTPNVKSHAQTLTETIQSYTKDAAYAEFQEGKKGQIKVGQFADLVLLSDNIFDINPDALKDVAVEMTVCNGRVVYE